MLKNRKYRELINYLVAGALTTLVSIGSYNIFRIWISAEGMGYLICVVLSWFVAVSFAYVLNRKFVFESKEPNILQEMSKFFGARSSTLGIEMLLMLLLVGLFMVNDRIAKVLVQLVILTLNYLFSKFLVFK